MLKAIPCLGLISVCLSLLYLFAFYSKEHRVKSEKMLNTPRVGIFKVISIAKRGDYTYVTVYGAGYRSNQEAVWHFLPWEISGCEDCADTIRIDIDHYPLRETSYKTPYKATLEKHHSSVYS
ncbi:hypothetical protein HGB13_00440 [bacterium]|nr:hypothetical protein [bacterium]